MDSLQTSPTSQRSPLWRYVAGLLTPVAITLLLIVPPLEATTIGLIYLLGIQILSVLAGLGPGLLASLGCFFAFNYFFLSPRYTFHVASARDFIHLTSFLVVAVLTSSLAARARHAVARERRRAAALRELYDLSQVIGGQVDLDRILEAVAAATRRLVASPACTISIATASGSLEQRAASGEAAPGLHATNVPIRDGAAVLGVVRVWESSPGAGFSTEALQLLDTLAAQLRLALDRAKLIEQTAAAQALAKSDELKSALLASVSHDLRTPLAVVKGAASTLLADDLVWDAETQRTLLQTIDAESDHLSRIVGNMLDMSRIDAGVLPASRDWYDIADVIGSVVAVWESRPANARICVSLEPDLPPVKMNPALIERVLANLLDNAGNYAPPDQPIDLAVSQLQVAGKEAELCVVVRDRGSGIPPQDLPHIFEKFFRGSAVSDRHGTGLGLTICKGIIAAHGGRIWATNAVDGGARVSFTLPIRNVSRQ